MKRVLTLVAVLCVTAVSAWAQVDRATVTGIVKDAEGAVVPGATVTVINVATNVETVQQTNAEGAFLVVNLLPGPYRIDVELTGFKKSAHAITLQVGQRARLDAVLEVGVVTEAVEVTASGPLLNAADSTLGAVISQVQVANLPLA